MTVALNAENLAWQKKAREFARDVLLPASLRCDRTPDPFQAFDPEIVRTGSRLGFRTAVLSPEYGGHGISTVTQALVIRELAMGDSAMAKTFTQCWKWSHMMSVVCTPVQKERYLRRFVEDDLYLLGHAGTEPNAGSDHRLIPEEDPRAGWKLRADRRGDEWILNGEKCFIANGSVAKLFFVTARTDPEVPQDRGTTEFLCTLDTPGLTMGKVYNKSGWRFYQNGELVFNDARVPDEDRVGPVNGGFNLRMGTSQPFGDLELSANALGICDSALELATAHLGARWPENRYFRDNQTVQLKLSRMHMLTEALRSFLMRVAMETDAGAKGHSTNNILLMNFATDVLQDVTALNMDLHASAGAAVLPPRVEKLVRDAFIWTHLAGDSVQRMKGVRRIFKA